MKVKQGHKEQPCAAILGHFVFGPVRCNRLTGLVEDETGDNWPVCVEHSQLDSGLKGIPVSLDIHDITQSSEVQ